MDCIPRKVIKTRKNTTTVLIKLRLAVWILLVELLEFLGEINR